MQDVGRIVGLHAVQHLHVERAAREQRRRGVAPVQAELAVVLLDVARPELLAAEVERLEHADAGHHPDGLAVGDRRRRRHVLLALHVVAVGERALPDDAPVPAIDRPQLETPPFVRGATFRKIVSPQMIGVEPLRPGIASFHAMFSVGLHLTGRPFSALTPFIAGPRHCGQFSADNVAAAAIATIPVPTTRLIYVLQPVASAFRRTSMAFG